MSGETILVVEDNDALRVGICEMLMLDGYQAIEARSGMEAVEAIEIITPDLILSDVMMPEMDGFDLYSAVRDRADLVTIPFIFLTARSDPAYFFKGRTLGVDDYLTKPVTREELVTAIRSRLSRYSQVKYAQVQQAYQASLTILADAIESRVPGTIGHIERMTEVASTIAGLQNWNERSKKQLLFGAILHDVGKLNISEDILFKEGPLDDTEWQEIRLHSQSGAEMIRGIPFLKDVAPLIRHHHERWDGKGYPDGLAGSNIPAGSRILAIADAFDAMTSKRVYSSSLTIQEAQEEVIRCQGSQFDPQVVDSFRNAWDEGTISTIYQNMHMKT
jgi:putative two-component system response regulator